MKNIHVLPTDKPSRFYINARYKHYEFCELPRISTAYNKCHNIYITSDEEIKTLEYEIYYNKVLKKVGNATSYGKKIILTTDQDLIKDGVQAINDNFLEWFVKNPSCKEVEVELFPKFSNKLYGIIIPKEEQKQHLIDMMEKDEELGLYDIENDWDKILEEYYDQPKLNFISLNKWLKENYEIPKKKMGTKQEIKLEDIFNDKKRQGIKEFIDKHKQMEKETVCDKLSDNVGFPGFKTGIVEQPNEIPNKKNGKVYTDQHGREFFQTEHGRIMLTKQTRHLFDNINEHKI